MNTAFIRTLLATIPKWVHKFQLSKKEAIFIIYPEYVYPVLYFFKNHSNARFRLLVDVCGVDYPTRKQRFEIVYNLLSVQFNSRIRIQTQCG